MRFRVSRNNATWKTFESSSACSDILATGASPGFAPQKHSRMACLLTLKGQVCVTPVYDTQTSKEFAQGVSLEGSCLKYLLWCAIQMMYDISSYEWCAIRQNSTLTTYNRYFFWATSQAHKFEQQSTSHKKNLLRNILHLSASSR